MTEYDWDFRNRLTAVRELDDSENVLSSVEYTYDVFDRRISKSYDADGDGEGSAVVTRFVYDGLNIVLTFDGDQAADLTHRYLHGPAVDQILADEDANNDILWPLADHQGTIRDLVDDSGSVQNHLEYDAFGRVTAESNSSVDHLFAYTGRERDEETGLQYHRNRYYDPAVGRWLSEDPIGFAAGDPNLTRYVRNNSINRIDPLGYSDLGPWSGYFHSVAQDPANNPVTRIGAGTLCVPAALFDTLPRAIAGASSDARTRIAQNIQNTDKDVEVVAGSLAYGLTYVGQGFGIFGLAEAQGALVVVPYQIIKAATNKGLAANPFQGKTPQQIDELLTSRGFKKVGPDPMNGKGSYFHPESGRKYYVDPGGVYKSGTELPRVDVHRMIDGKNIDGIKRKYPLGNKLYE